jgi:hypothetical protein
MYFRIFLLIFILVVLYYSRGYSGYDSSDFDVVVLVGPNDFEVIDKTIEYNKINVVGYRNFYVITPNPEKVNIEGVIVIDETVFPFNISKDFEKIQSERRGWYLQQLIKLYASYYVPGILDKYLVIDADTAFVRPIKFIDENGKHLYSTGSDYHVPYFEHMKRMHPDFEKNYEESGISHHMFFDKRSISEMFKMVEDKHNKDFWKVFIESVDNSSNSGASEYELYFNFIVKYKKDTIELRKLKALDISSFEFPEDTDVVSIHWHGRT